MNITMTPWSTTPRQVLLLFVWIRICFEFSRIIVWFSSQPLPDIKSCWKHWQLQNLRRSKIIKIWRPIEQVCVIYFKKISSKSTNETRREVLQRHNIHVSFRQSSEWGTRFPFQGNFTRMKSRLTSIEIKTEIILSVINLLLFCYIIFVQKL